MAISISLVVLVVFFFLRNGWATFIPAFGAGLAHQHLRRHVSARLHARQPVPDGAHHRTGFVVDDAIVVIENITRHIENGIQPMELRCAAPGDRVHGAVDEHFPHRGIYPDSDDAGIVGVCSANLPLCSRSPSPFPWSYRLPLRP